MIIELGELAIRPCTCPENEGSKSKKRALFFAKRDANLKLALGQRIDGGRSSMVEPQIVVLVVAGSSPVGHPIFKSQNPSPKLQILDFGFWDLKLGIFDFVSVAQPDRASDFGSEGCGFESLQARSNRRNYHLCFAKSRRQ